MLALARSLRCFDGIARHGSVRRAAESLYLTPAAVHRQLTVLEAQVGIPLFDRVPRGMRLTTAGEILLAAVRRGQRDVDAAVAQIEAFRGLGRGSVQVAVSEASAASLVSGIVETLSHAYPGLAHQVRTGSGEAIVKWVADGDVDFGYCLQRAAPRGVVEARTWPQRLGVISATGHPLATRKRPIALRACLEHPLVLPMANTELRAWADRLARRGGVELRPWIETNSVGLVERLVRGGAGIGLSIRENVIDDLAAGALAWLPLLDAESTWSTCLYRRRDRPLSIAAELFIESLDAAIAAASA